MNALTKSQPPTMVLRPQTFSELTQFAQMAASSDFVPPAYKGKIANVMLAVQMGSELGLAPMQSLQNIAVINGRPAVWGDAMAGLCRQSPMCEDIVETFEGDGETLTAVCKASRAGKEPVVARFSVADAKKAALFGKQGPWQQYPKRMLQLRARGFALRDAFPDILRGLITVEEARDIPPEPYSGVTIEAAPVGSKLDAFADKFAPQQERETVPAGTPQGEGGTHGPSEPTRTTGGTQEGAGAASSPPSAPIEKAQTASGTGTQPSSPVSGPGVSGDVTHAPPPDPLGEMRGKAWVGVQAWARAVRLHLETTATVEATEAMQNDPEFEAFFVKAKTLAPKIAEEVMDAIEDRITLLTARAAQGAAP